MMMMMMMTMNGDDDDDDDDDDDNGEFQDLVAKGDTIDDALLTDSWTIKNFFFSLVAESHMEWMQVCNMSALPHLGKSPRKKHLH